MQISGSQHLNIHYGNRLEGLVRALAEAMRSPLSSPLSPETIVVQSPGMAHWLSMQLARHHGICANVRFPFPNALVEEIIHCILDDIPERSEFEQGVMAWRIMKLLPELVNVRSFETLKGYLRHDGDVLRVAQLASRIADTFDQYLLFRPDMMLSWQAGEEAHWQAQLWRRICTDARGEHRAALAERFLRQLRNLEQRPDGFPERISIFGISALPPFHLGVLAEAARWAELHIYVLNPCREYWSEVVSAKEAGRLSSRTQQPFDALHFEQGNSLLASMGNLGRDYMDLLQDSHGEESECFEDPDSGSLLGMVQGDILALREGAGEVDDAGKPIRRPIPPGDDSIQVHSCHGPLREMEVLHDLLLDLFERDPSMAPSDILVMAPDIELYAPYIRAVFDQPAGNPGKIPFSIADQGLRREGRLAEPFLQILGLAGGRYRVSDVLSVLEAPPVREAFDIEETDMTLIRRWIAESGIRWGIDGDHRRQSGLPGLSENTWRSGMERLLLGYAMPGGGEFIFEGILPYDELEGGEVSVLGGLAGFLDRFFSIARALAQPRPPGDWAKDLTELLDLLFRCGPGDEEERRLIREILQGLASDAEAAGFEAEIDLRTVRWLIAQSFGRRGFGYGFMNGGVTFCAMLPMRSIPFRVICLAGLNHDAYPRSPAPSGFDLMAIHPRRGDRSRRNDDRYLFLETLISARDKLIVTYLGQSPQDNSAIPPSVLVLELLDYLGTHYEAPGGVAASKALTTVHHLQAFHPDYFTGEGGLFSYSPGCAAAAEWMNRERRPLSPFITGTLPLPDDGTYRDVSLADLRSFIASPARFLLQQRLGLRLEETGALMEDREPFDLKGLERYKLQTELLDLRCSGCDPEHCYELGRTAGRLPHGTVGRILFTDTACEVESFWDRTRPLLAGGALQPLDVDLPLRNFRLKDRLGGIYPPGLVRYRCATLKARDRLRIWIEHLVLNCLEDEDRPRRSILAGFEKQPNSSARWSARSYAPVEMARPLLEKTMELYELALQRPVPFFPESSMAYAEALQKNPDDPEKALKAARNRWVGNPYSPGEGDDPYTALCFPGEEPFACEEFRYWALELCQPLLDQEEKQP